MNADDREVCLYLRGWPGQFVSVAEITRRAGGKRRSREDPNWAIPVLSRLVEKGIVESDSTGHYRLKPRTKQRKPQKWVSPHIQKLLENSSKDFSKTINIEDDESLSDFLNDS
jgi:hypothetical protein